LVKLWIFRILQRGVLLWISNKKMRQDNNRQKQKIRKYLMKI